MVNCPYLVYKESKGCVNCLGWRCTVGEREKKLTNVSVCQNEAEWLECPKYLSKQPQAEDVTLSNQAPGDLQWFGPLRGMNYVEASTQVTPCPYLGDLPPEGCCNAKCYAKNIQVVPRKNCRNFEICTRYLSARLAGISFR